MILRQAQASAVSSAERIILNLSKYEKTNTAYFSDISGYNYLKRGAGYC